MYMFIILFSIGPTHQFDRYYKLGRLDNCLQQRQELMFCMQLKFASPQETKVSIYHIYFRK